MYSSKPETQKHIDDVSKALTNICAQLVKRAEEHDKSKMKMPELKYFNKYTPLLKTLKYGSKEYQDSLNALKPALEHHYKHNRHHPEHWQNDSVNTHPQGDRIACMNLIDIIEMFCDWWAASKRTKDGNLKDSIEISCKRFDVSPQLRQIFINTANDLEL